MARRVQRSRARGARLGDARYVGRPGPFGNPFAVGDVIGDEVVLDRADAVARYRDWIRTQPALLDRIVAELAGQDLACWCPLGEPCHADVLLELACGR